MNMKLVFEALKQKHMASWVEIIELFASMQQTIDEQAQMLNQPDIHAEQAKHFADNATYYRNELAKICMLFGPDGYRTNDDEIGVEPLVAKAFELVVDLHSKYVELFTTGQQTIDANNELTKKFAEALQKLGEHRALKKQLRDYLEFDR